MKLGLKHKTLKTGNLLSEQILTPVGDEDERFHLAKTK